MILTDLTSGQSWCSPGLNLYSPASYCVTLHTSLDFSVFQFSGAK